MTDKQLNYKNHIITDPEILGGQPVIKGTRIPVTLILDRLAEDTNTDLLFADYPQLTQEDIKACILYAYKVIFGQIRKKVK